MSTVGLFKSTLLASVLGITLAAPAYAAGAAAADVKPSTDPAAGASSADTKGQANDSQSLTTADIIVTGTRAAAEAPVTASLTTTQPQAVVGRNLIDNALPITSDFNQLVLLTPGVSITGTANGVGLQESKVQIRGFQDGEYNVTYDSVPFADTNNPTHHSTSFFPANTIETVVVDRGPGNASQLGQATYGGNLNIYSRAVSDEMGGRVDLSYGSFNTFVGRAELQSGKIASLGGAQILIAGQYLNTGGALTFQSTISKNIFAKAIIPLGEHNTLTVLATYNRNFYYQSDTGSGTCGAVTGTVITGENCTFTSSIGIYGKNFGLTGSNSLAVAGTIGTTPINYAQNYFLYNRTDKTTDFTIVRLQSNITDKLVIDNRLYMYGYTNNTLSGQDATGRTPNTVTTGFATVGTAINRVNAVGIPGYTKLNKYRVLGYIGQVNYEFDRGRARVGGWYEYADTDRNTINIDLLTGLPNFRENYNNSTVAASTLPSASLATIRYLQSSGWKQYQLFAEVEYEIIDGLKVTPGVKYVHFARSINATVNQTSRSPINTQATWTKTLPFLTANYSFASNWTGYFQYAKGMYVPDLSSFYTAVPTTTLLTSLSGLQPQTTTNYQLGTVYHGARITFDADVFLIKVKNKIAASPDPAASGLLINIGEVTYRGIEAQLSYSLDNGITLFTNASLVDARNIATNQQVQRAPKGTAAVGIFYQKNDVFASFTQKYTGPSYANEYNGLLDSAGQTNRLYRLKAYSIGDFSLNYTIGNFRLGVNVGNVFDDRSVATIGTSATGAPTATIAGKAVQSGYGPYDTFLFNPPRSYTASVRYKF